MLHNNSNIALYKFPSSGDSCMGHSYLSISLLLRLILEIKSDYSIYYCTGEEALVSVMEDLTNVLPQCYKIGKILGLRSSYLEEIKEEQLTSYDVMTLIIMRRLKDGLTWKSLVQAVAHKDGGNNVPLAMKLTDKHKKVRFIFAL